MTGYHDRRQRDYKRNPRPRKVKYVHECAATDGEVTEYVSRRLGAPVCGHCGDEFEWVDRL